MDSREKKASYTLTPMQTNPWYHRLKLKMSVLNLAMARWTLLSILQQIIVEGNTPMHVWEVLPYCLAQLP